MKIDVQALGAFNRMAHEGAQEAAGCLGQLTGVDTFVEITKITFVPTAEARRVPAGDDLVGVKIGLDGALTGETIVAFGPESAHNVVELLLPGADKAMEESAIREVGNIMTSGFIDGWAASLESTIDITPPEYVEGSVETILGNKEPSDGHVVAFSSRIESHDSDISFRFFMLPEPSSLEEVFENQTAGSRKSVDLDKLAGLTQLTRNSASTVSESLSMMTGMDASVEITELSFIPVEDVPQVVSERPQVGVVMEFIGPPSGFMMILFSESSAQQLISVLVPGSEKSDSFDGMSQSAVQEIGNVMTSSFIDGWANVLGTTIDISTPQFVHDMGQAIMDPVVIHLGQTQKHVFAFDTTIETTDHQFECDIYALPNETELHHALTQLDIERVSDGSAERI